MLQKLYNCCLLNFIDVRSYRRQCLTNFHDFSSSARFTNEFWQNVPNLLLQHIYVGVPLCILEFLCV